MSTYNPQPKSLPKEKKKFGYEYWNSLRAKSHKKKQAKMKESGVAEKDKQFYEYCWKVKPHFCEECGKELTEYKRWWIAHLLPKKSYNDFRHDVSNAVILCYTHHGILDHGSASQRMAMKTFPQIQSQRKKLLESAGVEFDENYWENYVV